MLMHVGSHVSQIFYLIVFSIDVSSQKTAVLCNLGIHVDSLNIFGYFVYCAIGQSLVLLLSLAGVQITDTPVITSEFI